MKPDLRFGRVFPPEQRLRIRPSYNSERRRHGEQRVHSVLIYDPENHKHNKSVSRLTSNEYKYIMIVFKYWKELWLCAAILRAKVGINARSRVRGRIESGANPRLFSAAES